MSRCFPFPPPGYVKIGARSEGSVEVESIKLQKERKKADKQSRREKKRQKKEKELLKKQLGGCDGVVEKLNEAKSLQGEKRKKELPSTGSTILSDDSCRSELSEEHGKPIPWSVSDGMDSHKKRKRDDSTPGIEQNGSKFRVSFTFKRASDLETPIGLEEPTCSTSQVQRHSASEISTRSGGFTCSTSQIAAQSHLQQSSSAHIEEVAAVRHMKTTDVKVPSRRRSSNSMYKALIEDWVPHLMEMEESDDQEWLLGPKQMSTDVRLSSKTEARTSVLPLCQTYLLPQAHYLPEAEIYALPFTVPY